MICIHFAYFNIVLFEKVDEPGHEINIKIGRRLEIALLPRKAIWNYDRE
jgi:hypothetical protein